MHTFHLVSLFPEMFSALTEQGVCGRAIARDQCRLVFHQPRDFAVNAYGSVDDRPFGGGPGMVMRYEPLAACIEQANAQAQQDNQTVHWIYLSPQGQPLTQQKLESLTSMPRLGLLCGRYEGVDERVIERYIDEEISIGDYVLSGGELGAMVLLDGLIRLLPGVLNHAESAQEDSFSMGLLDCPHYTRPEVIEGLEVPSVLLSGHHAKIIEWRAIERLKSTWQKRPDLLRSLQLTPQQQKWLEAIQAGRL
jgi:tRNA (guanine37-N1)-methyltransferase